MLQYILTFEFNLEEVVGYTPNASLVSTGTASTHLKK